MRRRAEPRARSRPKYLCRTKRTLEAHVADRVFAAAFFADRRGGALPVAAGFRPGRAGAPDHALLRGLVAARKSVSGGAQGGLERPGVLRARRSCDQPLRDRHDIVFSLERVPGCDIYRAGDGVHADWLAYRQAFSSRHGPAAHAVCARRTAKCAGWRRGCSRRAGCGG